MMPCIMIIYAYLNAFNDKKILFCNHKIRRNEKNQILMVIKTAQE